jgi:Family of unknown function (DUF6002)
MAHIDDVEQSSNSLLARYYRYILKGLADRTSMASDGEFEAPRRLPELDGKMAEFLAPATASIFEMGLYDRYPIRLLDLRSNANTQTTKTFASRIIVARAIRYIQETGRDLLLFSPSSGNKAVALRDAVAGALQAGVVKPSQLRILTLTPAQTVRKLRASILSEDAELRALNPVFVLRGKIPEDVKVVGRDFQRLFLETNTSTLRLWHSLSLENYQSGDIVRAFYDYEFGHASREGTRTVHAHAVSSAYGLLGYARGTEILEAHGYRVSKPKFLLVQHMATCDMVLHLLTGSFDREHLPAYSKGRDGIWVQRSSSHFPTQLDALDEVLEHTFYTHKPATAPQMSELIRCNGGTGIVVSKSECLENYGKVRKFLSSTPITLPDDPQHLNEWSLVMAMTGVFNAIDRNLLTDIDGVTVHASGSYTYGDYSPISDEQLIYIDDARQILATILEGASHTTTAVP